MRPRTCCSTLPPRHLLAASHPSQTCRPLRFPLPALARLVWMRAWTCCSTLLPRYPRSVSHLSTCGNQPLPTKSVEVVGPTVTFAAASAASLIWSLPWQPCLRWCGDALLERPLSWWLLRRLLAPTTSPSTTCKGACQMARFLSRRPGRPATVLAFTAPVRRRLSNLTCGGPRHLGTLVAADAAARRHRKLRRGAGINVLSCEGWLASPPLARRRCFL